MAHLQVPTTGTTVAEEPRPMVPEVALLYAQHKPGFHGNILEEDARILGSFGLG